MIVMMQKHVYINVLFSFFFFFFVALKNQCGNKRVSALIFWGCCG